MDSSQWRLERFDPETEARYQADLTARVMPLGRIAALFGAVLFLVLIPWDIHLDRDALGTTIPIRIVVSAMFLAAFGATFTEWGRRSVSPYMSLHLTIGVFYPMILAALAGGFIAGVPGEILAMIVVPILSTRLWHAVVALGILTVLPNAVMALAGATRFEIVQANYWFVSGAAVAAALTYLMSADRRRAFASQAALESEQRRSEGLLRNILPEGIIARLKTAHASTSDEFPEATVIFADIAGFTRYAESATADDLVSFLNALFSEFDDVVAAAGVEKIKTIGDSYMAVAGVPEPLPDHAAVAVETAKAMLEHFHEVSASRGLGLDLRIGIHSGPLVGGVIGKRKFSYDVWGDTVNVASRMESTGVAGHIQISESTRSLLGDRYRLLDRGSVELKHHSPLEAYLVGG